MLPIDAQGEPLGPAWMYDDARCVEAAAKIAAVAPAESAAHGAGSSLAKCLTLAQLHPRGTRFVHQADWIAGRLLGRYDVSDENNALKMGYDPVERAWPAWLERLGIPLGELPRVVAPGTGLGTLDSAVARSLDLDPDCEVVAGTTDSTAAAIAAGLDRPGRGITSLGSTLVVKIVSDRPIFDAARGVYSHRVGDLWLAGGASNSGGAVVRQFFDDATIAELSRHINASQPSGLDYYPLPATGERFPDPDPQRTPQLQPRPTDDVVFLHGLLEGIAKIEARAFDVLHALGAPALREIVTLGGGARNTVWSEIRSRLTGVPVHAAEHTEAAYGGALLARDH